jgi:hypothetical protein
MQKCLLAKTTATTSIKFAVIVANNGEARSPVAAPSHINPTRYYPDNDMAIQLISRLASSLHCLVLSTLKACDCRYPNGVVRVLPTVRRHQPRVLSILPPYCSWQQYQPCPSYRASDPS